MNTIGQKYYKVWQVFSSQVEEQVSRQMDQAYEDCLFRLQKSKNYEDAVKHWNVQRKQLIEQIRKTDKKWLDYEYAQSLRLFSIWDDEKNRLLILENKLLDKLDRFQVLLEGKLAQSTYDHVFETCARNFQCHNCNEPIVIDKDVLNKHDVKCPKCHAENQYNPGDEIDRISEVLIEKMIVLKYIQDYNNKEQAFLKVLSGITKKQNIVSHWDSFKCAYFVFFKKYTDAWKKLSSNMQKIKDNRKQVKKNYQEFEMLYRYYSNEDNIST